MYQLDRRENTSESRSIDNEASFASGDNGTAVGTYSKLTASSFLPSFASFSQPPGSALYFFSLSFFLSSSRGFRIPFPIAQRARARMAVINRARGSVFASVQRATCCCPLAYPYVCPGKKRPRATVPDIPICDPAPLTPSFLPSILPQSFRLSVSRLAGVPSLFRPMPFRFPYLILLPHQRRAWQSCVRFLDAAGEVRTARGGRISGQRNMCGLSPRKRKRETGPYRSLRFS